MSIMILALNGPAINDGWLIKNENLNARIMESSMKYFFGNFRGKHLETNKIGSKMRDDCGCDDRSSKNSIRSQIVDISSNNLIIILPSTPNHLP